MVDDNLSIDFSVKHLSKVAQGLCNADYELAADFSKMKRNTIKVDGLIGIDVIQYMEHLCRINCLRGVTRKISSGIILFRDVCGFLTAESVVSVW